MMKRALCIHIAHTLHSRPEALDSRAGCHILDKTATSLCYVKIVLLHSFSGQRLRAVQLFGPHHHQMFPTRRLLTTAKNVRGPKVSAERLGRTLEWLRQEPRPVLSSIRALKITYAARNDHFGARHFAKEDLPRISYANQQVDIKVDRPDPREDPEKVVEPVINVTFENGRQVTLNMAGKSSKHIMDELMALDQNLH